jgi:hypothetical protein
VAKLNWAVSPPPTFAVNDYSVKEGNTSTRTVTFTITRSGQLTQPSSVSFKTVDGSAIAGKDYVAVPLKTLAFAAGEKKKTVTVTIKSDKKREKTEKFSLSLTAATGATIADAKGSATIYDND